MRGEPIIPTGATLSIALEDGTELTDMTDLGLAWKWAAAIAPGWGAMPYSEKCGHVAEALAELRRAYIDVRH